MKENGSCWLLDGKEAVRAYLNGASDYKLKKWINAGMPVIIDGAGCWIAHARNIEEWFRSYTRRRSQVAFDDKIEE